MLLLCKYRSGALLLGLEARASYSCRIAYLCVMTGALLSHVLPDRFISSSRQCTLLCGVCMIRRRHTVYYILRVTYGCCYPPCCSSALYGAHGMYSSTLL